MRHMPLPTSGVHARRVSPLDGHHLFGFHDVSPWSGDFATMLALRVDAIGHPPVPECPAVIGILDPAGVSFQPVDTTTGWNFPQGARQLWLADRTRYAYNRPIDRRPMSRVRDQRHEVIHELPWGVAAVNPQCDHLYSIDFGRVHRAGGYGHTGVREWGHETAVHEANGVAVYDLRAGRCDTLAALADCRRVTGIGTARSSAEPFDYVTHVVPSPSGRRIAFLYRSWLADGGLDTAVCTVRSDGHELAPLARGNFSHFDWRDDDSIVIWGPRSDTLAALRGRGGQRRGLTTLALRTIKNIVRPLVPRRGMLASCFSVLSLDGAPRKPFHPEVLTADGHPSFCPADRSWMLCDTYPDSAGNRELFLLETLQGRKVSLGTFREPAGRPDMSRFTPAAAGVDSMIVRITGKTRYMFTRSGLHCDLHPRWRSDGRQVTFDSRHEGSRQIYVIDTANEVCAEANG